MTLTKPISITEVLDSVKEQWYIDWVLRVGKREANKISKAAMKVGSRVDDVIKGKSLPSDKDNQEVKNCFIAYDKWVKVYQPNSIVPMERMTVSVKGCVISGEPDLMVDDILVDIKCSGSISLKYWIQVNMYSILSLLCKDIPLPRVAILRLDKKTGSYEFVVKDYSQKLCEVWFGLMGWYIESKGEEEYGGLDVQEIGEDKEVA